MSKLSYLWRRIGSYVIDLSVISMFTQVVYFVIGDKLILTSTNLLIDIIIMYVYLLINVAVAVGYNYICYKYFKYPLGKLLLSIKVLDGKNKRVHTKSYVTRECYKYTFIYATLGLYIPYQFFMYVIRDKDVFHDRIIKTHIQI